MAYKLDIPPGSEARTLRSAAIDGADEVEAMAAASASKTLPSSLVRSTIRGPDQECIETAAPASVQPPALCSDEEVSEEVSDDASEGVTDNEESIYYSGFEHSDETSDDERCRV